MPTESIILDNLSYTIENSEIHFKQINITFHQKKYGIVGPNGIGKSTLLKLIANQISPNQGMIHRPPNIISLPQHHHEIAANATIQDTLNITHIITAQQQIKGGNVTQEALDITHDSWDLLPKIETLFSQLELHPLSLDFPFHSLSGGQKTKVLITKALLHHASFILFDEPTNNLDKKTRQFFYTFIQQYQSGLIIASHDRKLLNKMDVIIEIQPSGITLFGGNHDFYFEQKRTQQQARQRQYQHSLKTIKKEKTLAQENKEKHQKLAQRGRKSFSAGKVDKLTAKNRKSRSEKTNQRNVAIHQDRINEKEATLAQLRNQIDHSEQLSLAFNATSVANSKTVLTIESLFFRYRPDQAWLLENINLTMVGAQRLAILGDNGSGKTTLLQLIRETLSPITGTITTGVTPIAYLDQSVSMLNPDLTLLENYLQINKDTSPFDAFRALAAFGFRGHSAEKKADALSGGERIRAGLATCILTPTPVQLILLDEPTNHLDFESITALESALTFYQGAIIAVSHDERFLNNIAISDTFTLPTQPHTAN